jgi:hypothetical protein
MAIYNGDGTYTANIKIKYTAAAGGEARRKELQMLDIIEKLPFVRSTIDYNEGGQDGSVPHTSQH